MHENWLAELEKLGAELDDRIFSSQELTERFRELVAHRESPVAGVSFSIKQRKVEYSSGDIGDCGSLPSTVNETMGTRDGAAIITISHTTTSDAQIQGAECAQKLTSVISKYWRHGCRDKFGVLDFKRPEIQDAVTAAIERQIGNGLTVAVAFLDIDNFKKINDNVGHDQGDEVIRDFSAVLERVVSRRGGICLNDGGDEFIV